MEEGSFALDVSYRWAVFFGKTLRSHELADDEQ
jgi:hypothetical protein